MGLPSTNLYTVTIALVKTPLMALPLRVVSIITGSGITTVSVIGPELSEQAPRAEASVGVY